MQGNKEKFLIIFDKKNQINQKYFDRKLFKKKIKRSKKVDFGHLTNIKNYDVILLIGFIKKIKLKKNKKYFTIHESNLPKGRGFSPIKHQIMMGTKIIICSCIQLNDKIDGGKIIFKNKLTINKSDLFDTIKKKQMKITALMLAKLVNGYPQILKKGKEQTGKFTYFKKLTKQSDQIDIQKSLISQIDKIRSTNHYKFKSYFFYKKKKFYLRIYQM